MPHESVAPVADPARAVHALERAVACAEHGVADRPIVLINPADLSALGPADIRPHLDRVLLGEHAGDGLDSLLVTGALDALLPDV
jgi:hypothetical protein